MSGPLLAQARSWWSLTPFKIVLIYIVVAGLWILLSDRLVDEVFADPEIRSSAQTYKGLFYVFATAWMLYVLIRRNTATIRRSEEALRESQERLARLVDTTPNGIIIAGREGRISYVNATAERMLGLARDEIVGRTYDSLLSRVTTLHGELFPLEDLPFERVIRQGESVQGIECVFHRPDGSRLILSANTAPLRDPAGNVAGSITSLTDITERKTAEKTKRDFYRRTILAATEGKLDVADRDYILRIAGPPVASWDIRGGTDLGRIRQVVAGIAQSEGMDENRVCDFVLAVGEATTNAFKHAGGGKASLHRVPGGMLFVVSDQGPGIEALTLPEVALKRGYSTAGTLGMGYKAIISVADEVYLATGSGGTTVGIEMLLHPAPQAGVLPDTWLRPGAAPPPA